MKKITIRLDDELHKQVRIRGIETEEPMQAMIERLLRKELKRRGGARKRGGRR